LNAPPSRAPEPPGLLKRIFIRYGVRFFAGCYLRVRVEGLEQLPEPPYLLNFSHPNWVDPFLVVSHWPRRHRLFIFGPKEEDMATGWRNRLIAWSHIAVPFKPSKSDLIDTTRRATAVLKAGYVLGIAGEGRLSDREGATVPLQDGAAFFALRAGVSIVPLAIIGTRWLRFGKTITLRAGAPVELAGRRPDREGVASLTVELQAAMDRLLEGVREDPPPGRFSRWLTDLFNDRPWLLEQAAEDVSSDADAPAPGDERR
jgi:1-acyl-sn-glycerol-3-phosphate acyltransferase